MKEDADAVRVSVFMDPALKSAVKETARANGRSMTKEIRHALRQHVERAVRREPHTIEAT